ncbi:hypothetical protein CPB85DRAFT_1164838, partial [Mucidula mucida]
MPRALPTWMAALKRAGGNRQPSGPLPSGVRRGYALPDPNVIANVENETTRAFMLLTYLKLRTILHYRLQSSVFEPLAAPVWRRVLGLELHGSKGDGWAAKAHEEVRQELSKCIEAGSMQGSVDLSNLSTASATWQGEQLQPNVLPAQHVCREILWELFETNFRYEFLVLDRLCY